MPTVALFDTHAVFYRAFHALPAMNTSAGFPTSALYGFAVLLLKVVREHHISELAFAIDLPKKTFRHDRFPAYKAHRERAPDPLLQQLARLPDLLSSMNVPVHGVPGFEADDVLATLAGRMNSTGDQVLVVTGDRDVLQVVRDNVHVLFLGARGKDPILLDAAAVQTRYGVPAAKIPMLIALQGDKADNLPGIAGLGERTAQRLSAEFANVGDLLARIGEVKPEKIRQLVSTHAEQLVLNEDLARLRTDVAIADGPATAALTHKGLAGLRTQFEQLEFRSLLPRIDTLMKGDG